MSLPTHLPSCGEPAIAVFEIFTRTGMAYSLDGRLNVCGAHVVPALTALRDASYEPHQATGGAGMPGRCGDGYDYVASTALTAPTREDATMSHPGDTTDPVPPLANLVSRMHWHRDTIRTEPTRYDSRQLATLRAEAMELYTAADRELLARERP